jgi:HYR domain/Secretion system C-terminal sorting domain/SprB repeat/Putative metal-binding motif/Fibronectin type III domain
MNLTLPKLRFSMLVLAFAFLMPFGVLNAGNNPTLATSSQTAAAPVLTLTGPGNQNLNTLTGVCFNSYGFNVTASGALGPVTYTISSIPALGFANLGGGAFLGTFNKGSTVVTVMANDGTGSATYSFSVVVNDIEAPSITLCPANQTQPAGGPGCNAVVGWAFASSDNCPGHIVTSTHTPGATFPIGQTLVTYTATDVTGNSSLCTFAVNVVTNVTALTCNPTAAVSLDAIGKYDVQANLVANAAPTATTACSPATVTYTASPALLNCSNIGTSNVVVTASAGATTKTCTVAYTVVDNLAPVITCETSVTAVLDNGGTYDILANGKPLVLTAADNCTASNALTYAISDDHFECADIATNPNTVTITVTDASGNAKTCNVNIIIEDNDGPFLLDPMVDCATIMPSVNTNGTANCGFIIPDVTADVTALYDDNCTAVNPATQSPAAGAVGNGETDITMTLTDVAGNVTNCIVTVTPTDVDAPAITCPADATVSLNGDCQYVVTAADLTPATLTDNCDASPVVTATSDDGSGAAAVVAGAALFTVGDHIIELTATDAATNNSACTYTLTVEDLLAPVLVSGTCGDIINVPADAGVCTADVTITVADYDDCDGFTDDNGIAVPAVTGATFAGLGLDYMATFEEGTTVLTFTITDNSGNATTCSYTVIVADDEDPIVDCPVNITQPNDLGTCDAVVTYVELSNTDNCTTTPVLTYSPATAVTGATFTGTTTVTITATDDAGNTGTCSFDVIIEDTEDPVADCQDITVQLDATGNVAILAIDVAGTSTDNCVVVSPTSVDIAAFTCAELGVNNVELTVTDGSTNTSTCISIVTVEDNVAPVAVCAAFTAQLDAMGTVTITAADVAGASTDNCVTVTPTSVDISTFTCAEIGTNDVILTVTDGSTNTSTCLAVVTVEDGVAPVAGCADFGMNLSLPAITPDLVDDMSEDNCTLFADLTFSVDITLATCAMVGVNTTVTLTVTDESGNSAGCTATMTVVDDVAPTATCKNISVNLTSPTIVASALNNGSTDNCALAASPYSANLLTFTCVHLPSTTVTLTVLDAAGNTSVCTSTVTVIDNIAPVANCPTNVTQSTDAGVCSAVVSFTVPPASDNCSATSVAAPASGSTFAKGVTTVTVTATDGNPNTATCTFTVTVNDTELPVAICKPASVSLNAAGTASITTADVNNASTDNCPGLVVTSVVPSTFTCTPTGANTVVLTVTDAVGNTKTCTAVVTVTDAIAPVAMCPSNKVQGTDLNLCSAVVSFTVPAPTDNCSATSVAAPASGTVFAKGVTTVTVTATDASSNTNTCTFTVTVNDTQAPVANCPANVSQSTDANLCSAVVNFTVPAPSDNCSATSVAAPLSGTVFAKGVTTVTVTATDAAPSLNTATCTFTVTVNDTQAPTAICQAYTANLSAAGTVTVTTANVNNVSTDNCPGIVLTSVTPATFNCSNVGPNTVTLLVTDGAGSTSNCTAVVTVVDITAPVITCPPAVSYNADPSACTALKSINYNNALAPIVDACGATLTSVTTNNGVPMNNIIANVYLAQFPTGVTGITLLVTDVNGNTGTCSYAVTVVDTQAPIITGCPANLTNAGLCATPVNWADPIPSDNCAGVSMTSNYYPGQVFPIGTTTVTYVATNNGLTTTCSFTVTVPANAAPVAACNNLTVSLTAPTVTAAQFNNFSTDDCPVSGLSFAASKTTFTCADVPSTTVTLTVTDLNGATGTCTSVVTVLDNIAPVAVCQPVTVNLSAPTIMASALNNGSSDNCALAASPYAASMTAFTCANIPSATVTLTVTDASGNTATCTSIVTVIDDVAPVAVCAPATVALDAMGAATVTAAAVNGASTDNCVTVTPTSVAPSSFTCANLGANNVTLTVTDAAGLTGTCVAVVTVTDAIAPVITCPAADVTAATTALTCDAPVSFSVTATDNCSATVVSVPASGSTFAAGTTTVTSTATDAAGNMATCTFNVVVSDATAPVAVCQPVTVNIDGNTGMGATTADAINNASSDNCTAAASLVLAATPLSFTCANIGANTATLTVTDAAGNASTCTAVVTVVAPVITGTATPDMQSICSGAAITDIVLASATTGATFAWVRDNDTNMTGIAASGSGATISGMLTNATANTAQTTVFTITPSANGCVGTPFTASVSFNLNPVATLVSTPVNCAGGSDGSINLTIATTGDMFAWSNGATTEDVTGLAAGTYTVVVTSAAGCTASFSATVTELPALVAASVETAPVLCAGGMATIMVSAMGGTTPYTGTGAMMAPAGLVTYTVTDAAGCTATTSITVTEPTALTATATATPVTCFGTATGTATVVAADGTAGYTYLWSNGQTGATATGLAAGTYSVVVKDANMCSTSTSVVVTAPAVLAATGVATNSTCTAATDGGVNLTVTGGTAAFTFLWSNGQTTEDLMAVAAGSYSVVVTDANGCTTSKSFTVVSSNLCAPVTGIVASGILTDQATITWTASPCATGYLVRYRAVLGGGVFGPWTISDLLPSTPASYLMEDLTPLIRYQVRVTAKCATNLSVFAQMSFVTNDSLYVDADMDGIGGAFWGLLDSLIPGGGYSWTAGDCNDNNAAISTVGTEICDGIDNDCDGNVDEGVGTTYYADADGDTYGDPASSLYACSQPAGYVTSNTDCNDFDAAIAPGIADLCNGIDNDCNGLIDDGIYVCPVPTGAVTSNITSSGAKLTWSAAACTKANYVSYRKTVQTVIQWTFVTLPATSMTMNLSGLIPASEYRWRVRAKCYSGTTFTAYTPQVVFTTLGSALMSAENNNTVAQGTAVSGSNNTMNVYPNPSRGNFTLELNGVADQDTRISVSDNMGRTVLSWSTSVEGGQMKAPFDLTDLPEGVYTVRVQLADNVLSQTVVKL